MRSRLPCLWVVGVLCAGLAQDLWAFQDVPVQFAAGPVHLAGTLTLPETPGPHPAPAAAVRKGGNTSCTTKRLSKAGHTLDNPAVSQTQPVPELLPRISGWLEHVAGPMDPN